MAAGIEDESLREAVAARRCGKPRCQSCQPSVLVDSKRFVNPFLAGLFSDRDDVLRQGHHRARRPRARTPTSRHVHRFDGASRAAPPDLRGRRQLGRRSSRRPQRTGRREHPSGQLGHRPGLGLRHPRRHHARAGLAGPHGRPHQVACGRKVRRGRLQSFGRIARCRHLSRERALGVADRRGQARREDLPAGVRARCADRGHGGHRQGDRHGHHDHVHAGPRHLRGGRVVRGDPGAAAPGDGVPHARLPHRPHRRARRRGDDRVPLRRRHPRLRSAHQRGQGSGAQARRLLLGRERARPRGSGDAVEHEVRRVRLLVREQHQHPRGWLTPFGLQRRPDADAEQVRAARRDT